MDQYCITTTTLDADQAVERAPVTTTTVSQAMSGIGTSTTSDLLNWNTTYPSLPGVNASYLPVMTVPPAPPPKDAMTRLKEAVEELKAQGFFVYVSVKMEVF